MALGYIPPGTYITQLYKPRAAVPPGVGFGLVLVGIGDKMKKIVNEEVVRGKIYDEALTVAGISPHIATLLNDSDEKKENTVVRRNGAILPIAAYTYLSATSIQIEDAYYIVGATYEIDYVSTDSLVDDLANAAVDILSVGLFANSNNYKRFIDYDINSGDIDWDQLIAATFTGANVQPWDMSTLDEIKIALDGKPAVTVTVTGAIQTAVTAAEVVADINAALNADPNYGPTYNTVASVVANKVKLTAPNLDPVAGFNSVITLYSAGVASALDLVFGLDEADGPYEYRGIGKRPVPGKTYFVTYTMERDASEYNVVRTFLSDQDFYDDIGLPAVGCDLSIAGELAWSQGVLQLYVIQVEDQDDDDIYTDSDFIAAVSAIVDKPGATDIVVLRSTSAIRAKVKEIVENESAQLKSNYKRYWCGGPRDTVIGDVETSDSFVFIASQELEVAPDSPARGRFVVVGPSNWTRSFIDENGITQTVEVDSNYAAVLLAAKTVAFERASDSLFGKTFTGLSLDEDYSEEEKQYSAQNGLFVLYVDGSTIKVYDSLTSDASGEAQYEEPSSSTQKDLLAFRLKDAIDNQLKGIVPDDVADFVGTLKAVVGGVILSSIESGDIGYYTNDDGTTRDLDYTKDIVAYRLAEDPRNYKFRYWYMQRYPAKRFWGEFTVDVPF